MNENCKKPCVYEAFKTEAGQATNTPNLSVVGNAAFCDRDGCYLGIDLYDNSVHGECSAYDFDSSHYEIEVADTPTLTELLNINNKPKPKRLFYVSGNEIVEIDPSESTCQNIGSVATFEYLGDDLIGTKGILDKKYR